MVAEINLLIINRVSKLVRSTRLGIIFCVVRNYARTLLIKSTTYYTYVVYI
jgi:hypothetical protein